MQKFLEDKREEIAALCRTHHVRRLAVFGSAVRDDFDPNRSDVDFVVEYEPLSPIEQAHTVVSLHERLTAEVGRPVDLLNWKYVDNRYLRKVITEEEQTLYAA